jgi:AcrR family transcriptional regulator
MRGPRRTNRAGSYSRGTIKRSTFRFSRLSPPLSTRSDAARNRETLLVAAAHAFASSDGELSMRAIAREAGVGIGTLYRHFPTREALVAAVYAGQVQRLTDGATRLLDAHPPAQALRRWMDLFADWVATKRGMLGTLLRMVDSGDMEHAQGREQLLAAVDQILGAGARAGDIRPDVTAEDVTTSLLGILTVAGTPDQRAQAGRLLDLLMDGLAPRAARGAAEPTAGCTAEAV